MIKIPNLSIFLMQTMCQSELVFIYSLAIFESIRHKMCVSMVCKPK